MENSAKTYTKYITLVLVVAIIVIIFAIPAFLHKPKPEAMLPSSISHTADAPAIKTLFETLSYKGEEGKDALILLKQHAMVGQDKSGLVTIISGRKADNSKHEYWAFYVNGKLSSVGPAEYQTHDTDTIEWKIQKY